MTRCIQDKSEISNFLLQRTHSVFESAYGFPQNSSSSDLHRVLEVPNEFFQLPSSKQIKNLLVLLLPEYISTAIQLGDDLISSELEALTRCLGWIVHLRQVVEENEFWWDEPLVNLIDSELSLEWWHNERKVTVYISSSGAEALKVWGADVEHQMEEISVNQKTEIEELWQWLISQG